MFCIKAKRMSEIFQVRKKPVASQQVWLRRKLHQVNKRYCVESTNVRADRSLQRYHQASLWKLENCWYATESKSSGNKCSLFQVL